MRIPRLLLVLVFFFAFLLISCGHENPLGPTPINPDTKEPISPRPMARACLQVGFGANIDDDTLRQISSFGWDVIRIGVSDRGEPAHSISMIQEAHRYGMTPIMVVQKVDELRYLPGGEMYELRNEPDLEGPSAEEYREMMLEAADIAKERGQILYVGAVSNLNDRGFTYLKTLRPFPSNVRISVHRYGDGTFQNPHKGFDSRNSEVKWLRETIGDLPFAVTEFGYPNSDLSEQQTLERIKNEYYFWYGKADFACLYQINDGPGSLPIDKFGIRRFDKSWKPSAFIFQEKQ